MHACNCSFCFVFEFLSQNNFVVPLVKFVKLVMLYLTHVQFSYITTLIDHYNYNNCSYNYNNCSYNDAEIVVITTIIANNPNNPNEAIRL